jgi:hypothetical protein
LHKQLSGRRCIRDALQAQRFGFFEEALFLYHFPFAHCFCHGERRDTVRRPSISRNEVL